MRNHFVSNSTNKVLAAHLVSLEEPVPCGKFMETEVVSSGAMFIILDREYQSVSMPTKVGKEKYRDLYLRKTSAECL